MGEMEAWFCHWYPRGPVPWQGEPGIGHSNSVWFMALLKDKPKTSQLNAQAKANIHLTPRSSERCNMSVWSV